MRRTSASIVVLMVLGTFVGCSADQDSGDAADPDTTTSTPTVTASDAASPDPVATSVTTNSPVTVAVAAGDEVYLDTSSGELIHRDGNGAYICVLRRADDLADLRAGFNGSSDPPADPS